MTRFMRATRRRTISCQAACPATATAPDATPPSGAARMPPRAPSPAAPTISSASSFGSSREGMPGTLTLTLNRHRRRTWRLDRRRASRRVPCIVALPVVLGVGDRQLEEAGEDEVAFVIREVHAGRDDRWLTASRKLGSVLARSWKRISAREHLQQHLIAFPIGRLADGAVVVSEEHSSIRREQHRHDVAYWSTERAPRAAHRCPSGSRASPPKASHRCV